MAVLFNVSLDYLVGIDKKEMVSIDELSDTQKEIVRSLIHEFQGEKRSYPGLSNFQQTLLNKILIEFNMKHG
jgi:hypothetical protein